jgi:hypothetical protein
MRRIIAAIVLAAAPLAGCVVYDSPAYFATASTYDRAWFAALDAMREQGVQIGVENRATGTIEGRRGGLAVTANIHAQADGRVRVEFNTRGQLAEDPGLSDRISRAYDARMGR